MVSTSNKRKWQAAACLSFMLIGCAAAGCYFTRFADAANALEAQQPAASQASAPSVHGSGGATEAVSHLGSEAPPRYQRALPSAVVLIDAGHGGIDGGTSAGDILEKDINLAVAQKLYVLLRSQGIAAVLNRTGDYALSDDNRWHATSSRHRKDLSQRRQLTEEIDTSLFVSLHVNAANTASKRGPLVLHQNNGESALLAFCIQDALNRMQQTRELPKYGKPYYLLRSLNQPAVIVEMGFLSNPYDRTMLTNRSAQTKLASTIAGGLRQYLLIAGTPDKLRQLDDDSILPQ